MNRFGPGATRRSCCSRPPIGALALTPARGDDSEGRSSVGGIRIPRPGSGRDHRRADRHSERPETPAASSYARRAATPARCPWASRAGVCSTRFHVEPSCSPPLPATGLRLRSPPRPTRLLLATGCAAYPDPKRGVPSKEPTRAIALANGPRLWLPRRAAPGCLALLSEGRRVGCGPLLERARPRLHVPRGTRRTTIGRQPVWDSRPHLLAAPVSRFAPHRSPARVLPDPGRESPRGSAAPGLVSYLAGLDLSCMFHVEPGRAIPARSASRAHGRRDGLPGEAAIREGEAWLC